MDLLCEFAKRFPRLAAEILERDRGKRRNFREETITDVLMAGLVPFEPFGLVVDHPLDESATGEDMDWEFVDEHATDGRAYVRLHVQAKRAILSESATAPYWYYRELDHAVSPKPLPGGKAAPPGAAPPKALHGTQHSLLVDEAAKLPGCEALYMFYHPVSALSAGSGVLPAVTGVNWMFADLIPKKLTTGRWPREDRKVETWRPGFRPLSDLLCFGRHLPELTVSRDGAVLRFVPGPRSLCPTPGEIVDRLRERREAAGDAPERRRLEAVQEIPQATLAALRAARDGRRAPEAPRPRAIFVSGPVRSGRDRS